MTSKVFIPTYLYIKQHTITGKLYLGITIQQPETYPGSGNHWKDHLKVHGNEVKTLWYCLFYSQEELNTFALMCSQQWNIVESDEWANLIEETGIGGGAPKGRKPWNKGKTVGPASEESKFKNSLSNKLRQRQPHSLHTKDAISKANTGKKRTKEQKQRLAESRTGITYKQMTVTCPHCGQTGGASNMKRWHFDNCKAIIQ